MQQKHQTFRGFLRKNKEKSYKIFFIFLWKILDREFFLPIFFPYPEKSFPSPTRTQFLQSPHPLKAKMFSPGRLFGRCPRMADGHVGVHKEHRRIHSRLSVGEQTRLHPLIAWVGNVRCATITSCSKRLNRLPWTERRQTECRRSYKNAVGPKNIRQYAVKAKRRNRVIRRLTWVENAAPSFSHNPPNVHNLENPAPWLVCIFTTLH